MTRFVTLAISLMLPAAALAIVEPKTGTEYPDRIVVESPRGPVTMAATGVGLREKTMLKVDIYTIVSYVDTTAVLGDSPTGAVLTLDVPKRLQMDMRRDIDRQKLIDVFLQTIERNFTERASFAADLQTFLGYFDVDAHQGDRLVFDYLPQVGLTTSVNGVAKGTIDNLAFVTALWSVWFGKYPADESLTRALVAQVKARD